MAFRPSGTAPSSADSDNPSAAGFYPNDANAQPETGYAGLWKTPEGDAESSKRSGFGFYPENIYGQRWVEEHALRFAVWVRDRMVDFAMTLAGKVYPRVDLDVSLPKILMTGFEDINRLIAEARIKPRDMQLPNIVQFGAAGRGRGAVPRPGASAPFAPGKGYNTALDELYRIAEIVGRFADTGDAQRVLFYLAQRSERREAVYNAWLTLPMNLTTLYYSPTVKAAIEAGLSEVAPYFPSIAESTLLAEILRSNGREAFAELVALNINLKSYDARTGNKTRHEFENLQNRRTAQLSKVVDSGLRPVEAPTPPAGAGAPLNTGQATAIPVKRETLEPTSLKRRGPVAKFEPKTEEALFRPAASLNTGFQYSFNLV